jgi:RNA polymerase sigma factor (sigma-70 family)
MTPHQGFKDRFILLRNVGFHLPVGASFIHFFLQMSQTSGGLGNSDGMGKALTVAIVVVICHRCQGNLKSNCGKTPPRGQYIGGKRREGTGVFGMATTPMSRVVGHLRKVALLQEADRLTDAQLLESYLLHGEDASFEALVRRHGPMILGVCRRVLHDRHDSEDAFQATFIVLLRKAASIGKRELLVNWLYGVAYRTALKARNATAKRRVKERQVRDMAQKKVTTDDAIQDLLPLLDQELSRLPDKYRVPIILCDLEGKTRKKAAEQLGLPETTLSMRLDRARAMLAKRLARHGTALSGAALALTVSQNMATASVPPSLVSSTVKIGALVVAGKTGAAAAISVKVAALTEGVVKTMLLTKLKTMVGVLAVVGVLGSGLAALGTAVLAENQVKSQKQQEHKREKPVLAAQKKDDLEKDAQEPPKDFTNNIGMKFVWISPGTFMMGSPQEEEGRMEDELQHRVTLTKGFYLGAYLVTQEQWQKVMGENPSEFGGERDLPVDSVSWDDCHAFITRLREKDKKLYRLPTEAEWEYACRSGTKTPFYFGKTISTDQANFDGKSVYGNGKKGLFRERTTPVGAFPANAWGLYDMHGNLWQWCEDRRWFYSGKDVGDPQGPEPRKSWTPDRMLRGGSWDDIPGRSRSACRFSNPPESRGAIFGCRVAMTYAADEAKQGTPPANGAKLTPDMVVQTAKLRNTLNGHSSQVWSVAYSPDGKTLASGSNDNTIKLWDIAMGKERASLKGHTGTVYSVAFSPDGKTLASASADTVKLWEVVTGKEMSTLKGRYPIAYSAGGKRLAFGSQDGDGTIVLWDVAAATRNATLKGHTERVSSVAFSPDGKTLASASGKEETIKLWDIATGREYATLKGHNARLKSVTFSPDGKMLASASMDQTIKLWDVATGTERATLKGHTGWKGIPDTTGWVNSVAFSPNGERVASGGVDETIKVWDVATRRALVTFWGHSGSVWSVAYGPDGRTVASGSADKTIKLWDINSTCRR